MPGDFQNILNLSLTLGTVIENLVAALICSLIIALIYRYTYRGPGFSLSFVHSLIILSMITAVVIAVFIMMFASGPISRFIEGRPTLKILALSFLLLIGVNLVAEGLHFHIPKGYTYFAMFFSVFVEMLNLRLRSKDSQPVHLRQAYVAEEVMLDSLHIDNK